MEPVLLGALSLIAILVLIFVGLHVGIALIIVSLVFMTVARGPTTAIAMLEYVPFNSVANYGWAVMPLFILMGELFSASGAVTALSNATEVWFGQWRGGLGMAVTALGAALGAVTGSALAAAGMMMRTAYPQMVKRGYDPAASAGLVAAASILAILIPPSIFAVFYAMMVNESVGKVLLAGFFPGLLTAAVYMLVIYLLTRRHPQQWPTVQHRFTWRQRTSAAKSIVPVALMMLIVLGGIYQGVFTPSEAGAAGSLVALAFVIASQRRKSGRLIYAAVWQSAGATSMIFFILIGAFLYGRFMAISGAAVQIVDLMASLEVSRYIIFALLFLLYLLLGCFLDVISMMAITLPVAHPLMVTLGFDSVWFGVIIVIMVGLATLTPPFGLNVFFVHGFITEQVELWPIFMAALPYVIALSAVVILLTIWPQIALFLPRMMMG